MKKKLGLFIALIYSLVVVFSIVSQTSFAKTNASLQAETYAEVSPTPFFFDPNADTGKVLLTVNCGEGGTVTPNGKQIIDRGTSVDFIFIPDAGYEVDKVIVTRGDFETVEITLTSYKYTEEYIDTSTIVDVTFKKTGNTVSGLEDSYVITETRNFSAVGSRMDVTDGLVEGSSRWKPIGYRFNDSTEWTLFDEDFSGEVNAEILGLGEQNLYVIFARQIYTSNGWAYQLPVNTSSMSLNANKKGKMTLAATSNIDFTLPFNPAEFVVDEYSFKFNVFEWATPPVLTPTLEPTIEPTTDPVITPTPNPTPSVEPPPTQSVDEEEIPKEDKPTKNNKKDNQKSPDTGDNNNLIIWITFALVAIAGAIVLGVKAHKISNK